MLKTPRKYIWTHRIQPKSVIIADNSVYFLQILLLKTSILTHVFILHYDIIKKGRVMMESCVWR